MSGRNLDPATAAALASGNVQPAILAQLRFKSGTERVWSGVGDLSWNGLTWKGLGNFASMGAITEASAVQAEGTSVTLSGIGLSDIALPAYPITPPTSLPRTPGSGESVAFAFATSVSTDPEDVPGTPGGSFGPFTSIFTGGIPMIGTAGAGLTSCSLSLSTGCSFGGPNAVFAHWGGFARPPEIPAGARITGVYPCAIGVPGGAFSEVSVDGTGIVLGTGICSTDVHSLGFSITAELENTLEGSAASSFAVAGVCAAVYYEGSPLTAASLMYESLNDIQVGGPAKIWFGLMSAPGTFIGAPYLVFSGVMDKPVVTTSPNGSSITLPLENRLVNLQRPSQRRYTTADQHLEFPTDTGFNWVEQLNDQGLRWGS